jgi:hypothetical protein
MILQVQAGGGGGEGKWPLKKHNQFLERWKIGTIASNFLKYTLKLVPLLV